MTRTERRFLRHVQGRYGQAVDVACKAEPAHRARLLRLIANAYRAEWDYLAAFGRFGPVVLKWPSAG